ncbi:MAG: AAA family ATPase [Pseudolabrys sp.]|nr:AAA family ATPase [Pseudolabrys sp.]
MPRRGLPVRNVGVPSWSSKRSYLVQGLIKPRMLAFMTGKSNAGKSPLALDIAAHVATGRPWQERKVKAGHVLYVSTEGWTGLGDRIEAIRREHFPEGVEVPFDCAATSIDLRTSSRSAKDIIASSLEGAQRFGLPPGLVIIDTLSHALGGGDESNPEHVRPVIKNCQLIASETGAAVLMLHHPTKNDSSDYRGSSILVNDTDLLIKVETDPKSRVRTVTTPRIKEFAEIEPMAFRIKVVELGQDDEGDPITSVVVNWIPAADVEFEPKLTPAQQEPLDALITVLANKADCGLLPSATFSEWKQQLKTLRAEKGKATGEDQALHRSLKVLKESGLVAQTTIRYAREGEMTPVTPVYSAPLRSGAAPLLTPLRSAFL